MRHIAVVGSGPAGYYTAEAAQKKFGDDVRVDIIDRLPVPYGLITHAGEEQAVVGFGEHLGNPLRLRRPLSAGVRVIVAHCASLGHAEELDAKVKSGQLSNFELFTRLMDEPRYRSNLFGDISAVVQANRVDVIPTLLSRRDWQGRLLNGSDYPLPGVLPLIDLRQLVARGLLQADLVEPLRTLRQHNVLLFDFVLKRSLALRGQRFAPQVWRAESS